MFSHYVFLFTDKFRQVHISTTKNPYILDAHWPSKEIQKLIDSDWAYLKLQELKINQWQIDSGPTDIPQSTWWHSKFCGIMNTAKISHTVLDCQNSSVIFIFYS